MQNNDLNLMFESFFEPNVEIQYIFRGYNSIIDVFIRLKVQMFSINRYVSLHFASFFPREVNKLGSRLFEYKMSTLAQ